jgi:hypothetical protein
LPSLQVPFNHYVYTNTNAELEDEEQVPSMFAFNGPIGSGKLVVQIDGSQWSSPFNVETVGTNGAISVRDKQKKLEYHLGVSLYVGKGQVRSHFFLNNLLVSVPEN